MLCGESWCSSRANQIDEVMHAAVGLLRTRLVKFLIVPEDFFSENMARFPLLRITQNLGAANTPKASVAL